MSEEVNFLDNAVFLFSLLFKKTTTTDASDASRARVVVVLNVLNVLRVLRRYNALKIKHLKVFR